jgi:hypothetical protein
MRRAGIGVLVALLALSPALACTLCQGIQNYTKAPLRQELAQSKVVLYGTLTNPRLGAGGSGTVDLQIESVLKSDPVVAGKKTITLGRYVPVDPKNPPRYLVFCNVEKNQLDAYRPLEVRSAAVVDYLRGTAALDPKDRPAMLFYFFRYLDHADPDVRTDAYLEFARASDQEVGAVAKRLDPEKLRRLVNDPQTPAGHIGLFAFLLGACGGERDAAFLRGLLDKPTERTVSAMDGILAGYAQLQPRQGWEFALGVLKDPKKPFTERDAVLRTLRFYHGWKGDEHRREILEGLRSLLPQGDIADLAIEDLRRWQWWDHTATVLALWGRPTHNAPIMKGAIVRYALSSPQAEATEFVKKVRAQEPDIVRRQEEILQFDKKK